MFCAYEIAEYFYSVARLYKLEKSQYSFSKAQKQNLG